MNRGPIGCWVLYTDQYDFDGDAIEEPNILFIHEISGYMIGHTPDTTMAAQRLLFAFAPYPRPDSPYGFGTGEIVGPFQREATLQWNQRNDAVSTRLEVPLLVDTNVEVKHSNMEWGNGRVYQVKGTAQQGSLRDVIWYPDLAQVPLASFEQEQQVRTDADMALGLGGGGGGSTSRKSAAEIKSRSSDMDLGTNEIGMEFRYFLHQIFDAVWSLTLQYGFNDDGTERNVVPGRFPFTKDMLSLPFKRQIAGEDDPIDKQAALEEMLGFYKTFQPSPFIEGDLMHRYNLERAVAAKFGITGLDGIFGTPQEAQQMKDSQGKMQEEKMQLEKTGAQAKIIQMLNRGRGGNSGVPLLTQLPPGGLDAPQQPQPGQPPQGGGPPQNGAPSPNGAPAQPAGAA